MSISAGERSNLREAEQIHDYPEQIRALSDNRTTDSHQIEMICSELYNPEKYGDNADLDCTQQTEEDLQPLLHEELEIGRSSTRKDPVHHS